MAYMIDKYEPIYTIGEAAKRIGVVVPLLRSLEKAGILLTARDKHGKRLYSECDLDYIHALMNASRLHEMSVEEIHCSLGAQRCWDIVDCPAAVRKNCPRYRNLQEPCWLRKDLSPEDKAMKCHDCPVYRALPEFIR